MSDLDIRRQIRIDEPTRQLMRQAMLEPGRVDIMEIAKRCGYRPCRWNEAEWNFETIPADTVTARPPKVGVQFKAFVSPFVTLGEIAAQAIKAQTDPEAAHTLYHRYEAMPYKHVAAARSEDHILRLCDTRLPGRRGIVPDPGHVPTAVVDVQQTGMWFTIRAWQPGEDLSSWLVRYGYVPTWGALEKVLFKDRYRDPRGNWPRRWPLA
jgi:phage terminase large subunit GpA-like protein